MHLHNEACLHISPGGLYTLVCEKMSDSEPYLGEIDVPGPFILTVPELCKNCGRKVEMICQRGTGYCCQNCAEGVPWVSLFNSNGLAPAGI